MPHASLPQNGRASRGSVALLAIAPAFVVVVVVLLVAFVGLTVDSARWTERRIDVSRARSGADAATTLAVETLWTEFESVAAGATDKMQALRVYLDGLGITNQAAVALPSDVELLPRLDLATDGTGSAVIDGTVIESVRVRRVDEALATRLEFSTTAVAGVSDERFDAASTRRTVQDVFVAEAPPFEGLDCVLLTNDTSVPLVPADPLDPRPFASLYLNDLDRGAGPAHHQVDGPMPESFPLPFPDDGGADPVTHVPTPAGAGDRLIDSNEFSAVLAAAEGHASGGHITVVPHGSVVPSTTTVATLMAGSAALAGFADGHVVMHGTAADPIRVEGDIAIAGDLVLSGVIAGTGNLQVMGNVFITGDVVYADAVVGGARVYGIGSSGTDNLLTIATGKNCMIGDVTSAGRNPANGFASGGWNFTLAELAIFNELEWIKTQPTLPDERGSAQHPNPHYRGPSFRARYYSMAEGAPAPIHNREGGYDPVVQSLISPERPDSLDPRKVTLADPGNPADPVLFDASGAPRAVVVTLAPTGGWLSQNQLRGIIARNYEGRDEGEPLSVDAWLYSSNSIFGLVPKGDVPNLDGRLRVNGAIIAPDVGLLAPGGMELNFDRRGRGQIKVRSTERLTIRRRLWATGDERRSGAVVATLPG